MSTLNVTTIQHESASGNNIVLDSDGNVEIDSLLTAGNTITATQLIDNSASAFEAEDANGTRFQVTGAGEVNLYNSDLDETISFNSADGSITVGEDADWATAGVGVRRSDTNWGIIAAHDESQDTASALLIASGTTPIAGDPLRIQINHSGLGGPGTADVFSVGWNGNVTMGKAANAGAQVRGVRFIHGTFNPLQSIDVAAGGGTEVVFQINLNGTPTYRLNGNGTTVTRGIAIELEPENSDNYTSTMVDGEEQQVYSGPVLSVGDELQALRARATKQDEVIAQMTRMLADLGADVSTLPADEPPKPEAKKRGGRK